MALVKCKPTSPGRRHVLKVVNPDLYKGKPYAPLLEKNTKTGGRNNHGRITTRHIGGGHKQHYRMVDFKRNKDGLVEGIRKVGKFLSESLSDHFLHFIRNLTRFLIVGL